MGTAGAIGLATTDGLVAKREGAELLLGSDGAMPKRGPALLNDTPEALFDLTQFLNVAVAQLCKGKSFGWHDDGVLVRFGCEITLQVYTTLPKQSSKVRNGSIERAKFDE